MPTLMRRLLSIRSVLIASIAFGIAACNAATGTPPTSATAAGSGSASPPTPVSTPAATLGAIDHPTGATDVVLRLDTSGGFVPMDLLASSAPVFTLYGNGIVIFQPKVTTPPAPDPSGLIRNPAWRAARLDEGQVQELLAFALGAGGLGAARDSYLQGGIADVPNTIFEIKAGGVDKTVVVSALSEDTSASPDSAARSAFYRLAERLRDFDQGGSISTDAYKPDAFRGVLSPRDPDPTVKASAWPWPSIKPADFKEADGSGGVALPHRTLSAAEVGQIGLTDVAGGVVNFVLEGPDAKRYALTLRPLLPDETE